MKNYFLGICGLVLLTVSSCRKVDDSSVFGQSPDQRINATLAKYQEKLSGAQFGWKAIVATNEGGNFTFYFSFNDSNRVKMMSSFDSTSATVLKESSYRLKALQQPSLLFDTYSYIHQLADPNPASNGGEAGVGLGADFEYWFNEAESSTDTIILMGTINRTKTKLIRATQQERDDFLNGELAGGLAINKILNYYKRFVVNGTDSTDAFIFSRGSYIIRPDDDGNLLDDSRGVTYTLKLGGLEFSEPIVVGTKTISELSNVNYDAATNTITATGDGQPVKISGVITPITVDVAAPERWWNFAFDDGSYWITEQGFHINGVDDAHGLANIPGYFGFSIFWPQYGVSGGINYDLLAPITPNTAGNAAIRFGAAYRPPVFSADGRVTFPLLGTLGTANIPASATGIFGNLRAQMAIPEGYYLVQISNDPTAPAYHMVSAADGLAWVTWVY
jgi:Domain of unknown function (DUF4302)